MLIIVLLWALGSGIIIDLAALQTVPAEQLEAARVDGAGPFGRFRHVILPAISPILLFQTVLTVITTFQTFIPAILLSPISGGSMGQFTNISQANDVYMVDVYEQFFDYSRYGLRLGHARGLLHRDRRDDRADLQVSRPRRLLLRRPEGG